MNRRSVTTLLAASLIAGAPAAALAQQWEPTFVDGVLQPLPDGFPNQPITLINVDDAGTSSGLHVRAIQKSLEGISPVDIRISDEPRAAGGTFHALAEVTEDREGGADGYFLVNMSVIGASTDFLTSPIAEETGLNFEDVNFFITTEVGPWLLVQRADAPWGTGFGAFVDYAKAHPGETKYISGGVGSGFDIFTTWILDQAGVEVNKVPAADRDAAMAAVAGGEGDVTGNNAANALAAADRIDVILASTAEVPELFASEGTISAKDFEKFGLDDVSWGSFQGFMVAKKVPAEHVAWLHALISAGAATDSYKEREKAVPGLKVGVTSVEETNAAAQKALAAAEPIVRKAGLHWEDNK